MMNSTIKKLYVINLAEYCEQVKYFLGLDRVFGAVIYYRTPIRKKLDQ